MRRSLFTEDEDDLGKQRGSVSVPDNRRVAKGGSPNQCQSASSREGAANPNIGTNRLNLLLAKQYRDVPTNHSLSE